MKPIWGWLVVVALVAVVPAAGGDASKTGKEESALLELTNQERKKRDLPPLRPNPELFKVARSHSENMARQGKMEHTLDGKTPFDRLRDAGYRFAKGGENLASGDDDAGLPAIMKAWMESKSHRDNILLPEFSEVGLGVARNGKGQVYYTQVFARPRPENE